MRRIHSPYATIPRRRPGLSSMIRGGEELRRGNFPMSHMFVPKVRKIKLGVLAAALLCPVSLLFGADPSVEVFSEEGAITSVSGDYITLFPQLPFRWSLTVGGGYDDNPDTLPDGAGSTFTQ